MSVRGGIGTYFGEEIEPHVTIQAKVIAAGVEGKKLKVALQLNPALATIDRPGFPLALWPSEVRAILRGSRF